MHVHVNIHIQIHIHIDIHNQLKKHTYGYRYTYTNIHKHVNICKRRDIQYISLKITRTLTIPPRVPRPRYTIHMYKCLLVIHL